MSKESQAQAYGRTNYNWGMIKPSGSGLTRRTFKTLWKPEKKKTTDIWINEAWDHISDGRGAQESPWGKVRRSTAS